MAVTNNTTIKPLDQNKIAKALESDPSKLANYWDQNPGSLDQAVKNDPGAFSLTQLSKESRQTQGGLSLGGEPNVTGDGGTLSNIGTSPGYDKFYAGSKSGAQQPAMTTTSAPDPWMSKSLQEQLQGAVNGSWNGGDLSSFFELRNDSTVPDEVRQQIAQAYSTRYGVPYIDPLQPTYTPPTNGMGGDGGPAPGGTTNDPSYSGPEGGNTPDGWSTGGQTGGTQDGTWNYNGDGTSVYGPNQNGPSEGVDGVYQNPNGRPGRYSTGDPELDKAAAGFVEKINSGELSFANDLTDIQKQMVLQGLDQAVASNPAFWNNVSNPELRNAYIARFGNPQEGVTGADQNTTNADGNVQGQWRQDEGEAYQAQANQREVGDKELASWQLNDLLATGSPLMTLARQQAADQAERVGMRNSSLAAGAAQAAMADRMTPLAQQNAQTFAQAASQNQALESERRMSNAAMGNDLMNADRQRDYGYNLQQLAGDQDFAKQELAGQKAADLANIEGQYKMLISENDSAARIFQSTYDSIAQILSNHELDATEAGEKADYLVGMMESMMESLLAFENFDLDGSGSTGSSQADLPASVQEMIDGPFGTRFQIYE